MWQLKHGNFFKLISHLKIAQRIKKPKKYTQAGAWEKTSKSGHQEAKPTIIIPGGWPHLEFSSVTVILTALSVVISNVNFWSSSFLLLKEAKSI